MNYKLLATELDPLATNAMVKCLWLRIENESAITVMATLITDQGLTPHVFASSPVQIASLSRFRGPPAPKYLLKRLYVVKFYTNESTIRRLRD